MLFSPLKDHAAKADGADLVLVEGGIDGFNGERLLIAPWHIHHHDDECFYVLEGRITFGLGDDIVTASAGDAVLVPHGIAHTWWNDLNTPARYLIAMPRRLDELIVQLHQRPRSPQELESLFRDFDSTYIGWTR